MNNISNEGTKKISRKKKIPKEIKIRNLHDKELEENGHKDAHKTWECHRET